MWQKQRGSAKSASKANSIRLAWILLYAFCTVKPKTGFVVLMWASNPKTCYQHIGVCWLTLSRSHYGRCFVCLKRISFLPLCLHISLSLTHSMQSRSRSPSSPAFLLLTFSLWLAHWRRKESDQTICWWCSTNFVVIFWDHCKKQFQIDPWAVCAITVVLVASVLSLFVSTRLISWMRFCSDIKVESFTRELTRNLWKWNYV